MEKEDRFKELDLGIHLEKFYLQLKSSPEGITADEAGNRLIEFGENLIPERKKDSIIHKVFTHLKNLFNILLFIASFLSFLIGWVSNDIGSIQMGFAILGAIIISIVFSVFQERRAEKAVEAIRKLMPMKSRVMRDSQIKEVHISQIVPGDVISLEEGDKVPADCRIISSYDLLVDNSNLTGESALQVRSSKGEYLNDNKVESSNLVFAGTTIASGSGTAIVFATGAKTEFGRVVAMTHMSVEPISPLEKKINHMAAINFVIALIVGLLCLGITYFFLHLQIFESLLFMVGVMISLVPEGLQVTLTLSLALSSLRLAKRNVIVKRLSSVETLGSTTVICTDKTGTITQGEMTVHKIWIGGSIFKVTGAGYMPKGSIISGNTDISITEREDLKKLCHVAALNNRATLHSSDKLVSSDKSVWTVIGDSTDAALLVLARKAGIQEKELIEKNPRISMIPLDSVRRIMTSIHKDEKGKITAYVKGAGVEILSRCSSIYWNNKKIPLTPKLKKQITSQVDSFADEAYRVLAIAVREFTTEPKKYESSNVECNLTFIGLVAIYDPPRNDVADAIKKTRAAGIKVIMMTGDHKLTAEAIAKKVGIISSDKFVVMTGSWVESATDEELSNVLDVQELVFARTTPEQKLRIVRSLRLKGETVAVTGDGANDAAALLEADIGIAMGISGTDVARESADMILMDDNFATIVNGVEQGRAVFDNLKKFIVYVFSHNFAELFAFIIFILMKTPLPLAVIQVLAIDLLLEIAPSLSLILESPDAGIMETPPRTKGSRLFDIDGFARSLYIGIIIGSAALFWCFNLWSKYGWDLTQDFIANHSIYLKGTTVVLVGIMAGQLGMLLSTRSNNKTIFNKIFWDKLLIISIIIEISLLLAIVYFSPLNTIFLTEPLEPVYWLYLYSIVPIILIIEGARKLFMRKFC